MTDKLHLAESSKMAMVKKQCYVDQVQARGKRRAGPAICLRSQASTPLRTNCYDGCQRGRREGQGSNNDEARDQSQRLQVLRTAIAAVK